MGWVGSELLFIKAGGSSFCCYDEVVGVVGAGIEDGIQQPRWWEEGVGSSEDDGVIVFFDEGGV